MRGNIMKIKKQFNNLKKGAKKVFIGMLILCLLSTITGIGSIFSYADDDPDHVHQYSWEFDSEGHTGVCSCGNTISGSHNMSWVSDGAGTLNGSCSVCPYTDSKPDPNYIPPCPHNNIIYTYNASGHSRVCDDCGATLDPEGHSFPDDWTYDEATGREYRTCQTSGCGYTEYRDATTPPTTCQHENKTYTYVEGEVTHTATCLDCGADNIVEDHNWVTVGYDENGNQLQECVCGATRTAAAPANRGGTRAVAKDFNNVAISYTTDFWSMSSSTFPYTLTDYSDPDNPEVLSSSDYEVLPDYADLFLSTVNAGSTLTLTFTGNGTTYTADQKTVDINVPTTGLTYNITPGSSDVTISAPSGVNISTSESGTYSGSASKTVDGAGGFDVYLKGAGDFVVKQTVSDIKNIGSVTYTPDADNYQSLDSSKGILDFYTLSDGSVYLQKDIQYTVSASSDPTTTIPTVDSEITLTYQGIGSNSEGYYCGTHTAAVYVADVDVLLNGAPQKTSYSEAVDFTADGYTISDSTDPSSFNSVFTYSTPTTTEATGKISLPLYFKKTGTRRIVQKTITDLAIDDTAGITILYNGSETKKSFYYGTVRISANGFYVSDTNSSASWSAQPETFDIFDVGENVKTLYFKNKTTGVVTTVRVTVTILAEIDLPVKYNGSDLKDWYNDDVTITASGYTISVSEDGSYLSKYVMTGSGTVEKELYFKDTTTDQVVDADTSQPGIQPYTIIVCIDRTAPTGTIYVGSYSSNAFTTTDSVKAYISEAGSGSITGSDTLSGIDYIHYYVSDTFYSSSSDLLAAISEKSAAWRTYSSSSKPTTVKDKNNYIYAKLVDKAGNETIISLGNILYDTVAPKMTTAKIAPSSTDTSKTIIGLAGTDKLSGINRFKYVFKEKEEGRKYDTPGKDWMFDNGEYVKTTDEKDGTAVASATMDALDPDKTYLFYFIAVDRAGNISEVMTQEVKGSEASSEAASGSGNGSGSGSNSKGAPSGLTPAPHGLAGGGSGSGKQGGGSSGSGSSKSSKDKNSQSALGDKDREINRNPYIAEATGNVKIGINETSGWNKIASEVNKANKGAVIEVEMAGLSNVSNELFTSMNNRDVQVKLRMADDVEWEIKGEEVPNARSDIDMGVRLGSRNIPEPVLTGVTGSYPHVEFSINHDGDFGFVATISVPVGESNKGMYTTLYHYDEAKKELEVAGNGRVDDKGYTKFPLTHASDYTVVITPERILSAAEIEAATATLVGTEDDSLGSNYLDGARLRLTDIFRVRGSMRIWLFIVALLSATICLIILYLPALQLRNQNDQGDLF